MTLNIITPSYLDIENGIGMMGSDASLRKILSTVTSNLHTDIQRIGEALGAGDVLSANRLLHAIKGYSPIFCTTALVAQVTEIEVLSKTAPVADVQPLFDVLKPCLDQLVKEINAYLAEGL